MRVLRAGLLLLALVWTVVPAQAAITHVGGFPATRLSAATVITTSAAATSAGHLIVCTYQRGSNAGTVTVTDVATSTWHLAAVKLDANSTQVEVWYAMNVATQASETITFTVTGSNTALRLACDSYAGLATTSALDKVASNNGTGTAFDAGNVTTTVTNEVIQVGCGNSTALSTFTVGASYTLATGDSDNDVVNEFRVVSATGTYGTTSTYGASVTWACIAVTFADTPVSTAKVRHRTKQL